MKVSKNALDAIKGNARIMNILAAHLDFTESSVRRWIKENEEDGALTTATAVKIISEETGIKKSEILIG